MRDWNEALINRMKRGLNFKGNSVMRLSILNWFSNYCWIDMLSTLLPKCSLPILVYKYKEGEHSFNPSPSSPLSKYLSNNYYVIYSIIFSPHICWNFYRLIMKKYIQIIVYHYQDKEWVKKLCIFRFRLWEMAANRV